VRWPQADFQEVVKARGSGTSGLPQSQWQTDGAFPVIGQGAEFIEGWSDRSDLVIEPGPGIVLYGGHTRRAKFVDMPFVPGPNVKLLKADVSLDPKFLYHYLAQLKIESRGYADHFPEVRRCSIPLPPLAEQRRIAAVLDKADAVRAKRREATAKLEQLLQSVFVEMFGDPAGNSKGWPIASLAEVVNKGTIVTYGIVQAGEEFPGGVPYIRTGDIVDGQIVESDLRHTDPAIAEKFSRSRVDAGDIVMSIRATVGTTAVVPDSLAGANLTQGTARIAVGEVVDRHFALHHIRSLGTQRWIERQVKGATFREITLARLRELPVLLPPRGLQDRFAQICHQINKGGALAAAALSGTEVLFASLQHRAFAGTL
jgi:type I restriction enzyme S subunit